MIFNKKAIAFGYLLTLIIASIALIILLPTILNIDKNTKTGLGNMDISTCEINPNMPGCEEILGINAKSDNYDLDFPSNLNKDYNIKISSFDINEYAESPYGVTIIGETGQIIPTKGVKQIQKSDTGGTHSYGNFGLNSKSGNPAHTFWNNYGNCLKLEGTPGTNQADKSWSEITNENTEGVIIAEIDWYNKYIINPTLDSMNKNNFPEKIMNNPMVIAYLSDVTIQMGPGLRNSLINKIQPIKDESPQEYLERLYEYQYSDEYLKSTFSTYLNEYPSHIKGLKNRIQIRYDYSQKVNIAQMKIKEKCTVA